MCEMFEGGKGLCSDAVCVEDFCGRGAYGFPTSFWADWCPHDKVVYFGGAWGDVPNMPADSEPPEEEVGAWVKKHQEAAKSAADEVVTEKGEEEGEVAVATTPGGTMKTIGDTMKLLNSMQRFDRLGGSDSLFGQQHVLEMLLEEEHEKVGKTDRELGMFRYKGMCQYGNILDTEPTTRALARFMDEFGYSEQVMERLQEQYENMAKSLGGLDCGLLSIYIKYELLSRRKAA